MSLVGQWLGLGWPSWLDREHTRLCIFTWQNYVEVRFAVEVLVWHLKEVFIFKPGPISTPKNHCHPVSFLSNMLQQQSREGNHFLSDSLIPCPISVPFFILQFHYFLTHNSMYLSVFLFLHNRMLRFFSIKKIAFVFCPVLKLAKGSSLVHSRLLRNCSSASPLWRDALDSRWGWGGTADHSLALRKDWNMWQQQQVSDFADKQVIFFFGFLCYVYAYVFFFMFDCDNLFYCQFCHHVVTI